MIHLYGTAAWMNGDPPFVQTACGLRKPHSGPNLPPDVVEALGAVTCPACREKGLLKAQSGKKAQ